MGDGNFTVEELRKFADVVEKNRIKCNQCGKVAELFYYKHGEMIGASCKDHKWKDAVDIETLMWKK